MSLEDQIKDISMSVSKIQNKLEQNSRLLDNIIEFLRDVREIENKMLTISSNTIQDVLSDTLRNIMDKMKFIGNRIKIDPLASGFDADIDDIQKKLGLIHSVLRNKDVKLKVSIQSTKNKPDKLCLQTSETVTVCGSLLSNVQSLFTTIGESVPWKSKKKTFGYIMLEAPFLDVQGQRCKKTFLYQVYDLNTDTQLNLVVTDAGVFLPPRMVDYLAETLNEEEFCEFVKEQRSFDRNNEIKWGDQTLSYHTDKGFMLNFQTIRSEEPKFINVQFGNNRTQFPAETVKSLFDEINDDAMEDIDTLTISDLYESHGRLDVYHVDVDLNILVATIDGTPSSVVPIDIYDCIISKEEVSKDAIFEFLRQQKYFDETRTISWYFGKDKFTIEAIQDKDDKSPGIRIQCNGIWLGDCFR
jgi:hypothetical protein